MCCCCVLAGLEEEVPLSPSPSPGTQQRPRSSSLFLFWCQKGWDQGNGVHKWEGGFGFSGRTLPRLLWMPAAQPGRP